MSRIEALEELQARRLKYDLTTDGLFELVLLATGNRDTAERAARDLMAQKLRAGETPT